MKDKVSSQPVTLLKHVPALRSPVPSRHKTENVVYAEVHQQPRVCVTVLEFTLDLFVSPIYHDKLCLVTNHQVLESPETLYNKRFRIVTLIILCVL